MAAKKMPSKKMPDPVKSKKASTKGLVEQAMKLGVDPTKYVKKKK